MAAFFGLFAGVATLLLCRWLGMDSGAVMRGPAGVSLPAVDVAWVLSVLAGLFGGTLTAKYPWLQGLIDMAKNRTLPDLTKPGAIMEILRKMLEQFGTNQKIQDAIKVIWTELSEQTFKDAKEVAIETTKPVMKSPFRGR
jgi:hypothetical protein